MASDDIVVGRQSKAAADQFRVELTERSNAESIIDS
jgi:hypothetical protein